MANRSLKGGAFERDVCGKLSSWWTEGVRDDVFWRTAGSGGRATRRKKAGKETANSAPDVGAEDAIGIPLIQALSFELKTGYKGATSDPIGLVNFPHCAGQLEIEKFFEQAKAAQALSKSISWAVIFRQHGRKELIFLPFDFADRLNIAPNPMAIFKGRGYEVVCTLLRTFFMEVRPQQIIDIVNHAQKSAAGRLPKP